MTRIVECVPNISEGRDLALLDRFAAAVTGVPLLHRCADADHNRAVFTFAGEPEAVLQAALSLAAEVIQNLDLRAHMGVHPRIGVLDVLPFVPVRGVGLEDCAALAHQAARQIWTRFQVPAFFYEAAGFSPLEAVRKRAAQGAVPDVGTGRHPSAGAVAIGARPFLIAWNIWLQSQDVAVAKRIASRIRASGGGFAGVKALGLPLASRDLVQISINTTDYLATPPRLVYQAVKDLAGEQGVGVMGAELIGLLPSQESGMGVEWLNDARTFPNSF